MEQANSIKRKTRFLGNSGPARITVEMGASFAELQLSEGRTAWVIPSDANVGLDGGFADAFFQHVWGTNSSFNKSQASAVKSEILIELRNANRPILTSGMLVFNYVGSSPGIVPLFVVTAFDGSGKAGIDNVRRATLAIAAFQPLGVSPTGADQEVLKKIDHIVIPLLGAGQGGLDAKDVARTITRTLFQTDIHPQIRNITIVTPDADSLEAAIAVVGVRAQRAFNDVPQGDDRLNIQQEADALSEMLLLRNVSPPLVVGILGGWGSGKSFVMHLMDRRMREIRAMNLDPESAWKKDRGEPVFPYVGHVYPIRFDAWTYAKSDLWASLMQSIYHELDSQLRLENQLKLKKDETLDPKRLCQNGKVWFEATALHPKSRQRYLETEIGRKALDKLSEQTPGNRDAPGLLEVFRDVQSKKVAELADARKKLDELKQKERSALEKAEEVSRQARIANELELKLSEKMRTEAAVEVAAELDREARSIEWDAVYIDAAKQVSKIGSGVVEKLKERLDVKAGHPLYSPREAFEGVRGFLDHCGWVLRGGRTTALPLFIFAAVSILAPFILKIVAAPGAVLDAIQIPAWLFGAVSTLGGAWETFTKYKSTLDELRSQYESKVADSRAKLEAEKSKRIEELVQSKLAAANLKSSLQPPPSRAVYEKEAEAAMEEARNVELKIESLKISLGEISKLESLSDHVTARAGSAEYSNKLGLVHLVQRDIQDLTECIVVRDDDPLREEKVKLFPRGPARIVLFIDDLDRCPPDAVVRVLEAAQLLVKTSLFVVVIAMDLRYVTRALEKHYEGILTRNGEPSGLDYLEKIIQIPYRVRPVREANASGFIREQMQVRAEEQKNAGTDVATGGADEGGTGAAAAGANASLPGERPDVSEPVVSPVPRSEVEFEEFEARHLEYCIARMEITPRSIKRIINVLKLMKLVWHRSTTPPKDGERAIISLLVASAKFPEEINKLIAYLDSRIPGGGNETMRKIVELMDSGGYFSGDAGRRAQLVRIFQDPVIGDAQLFLLDQRLLDLLHSFSFLGSPGSDIPAAEQSKEREAVVPAPREKTKEFDAPMAPPPAR